MRHGPLWTVCSKRSAQWALVNGLRACFGRRVHTRSLRAWGISGTEWASPGTCHSRPPDSCALTSTGRSISSSQRCPREEGVVSVTLQRLLAQWIAPCECNQSAGLYSPGVIGVGERGDFRCAGILWRGVDVLRGHVVYGVHWCLPCKRFVTEGRAPRGHACMSLSPP